MKHNAVLLVTLAGFWILIQPLMAAPPPLAIEELQTGQIRLSWPADPVGFNLEQADSLSVPVQWRLENAVAANVGGRFSVTIQAENQTRFYRLRGGAAAARTILETSPALGESGVAVTRETILRFSAPLAADAMLTTEEFHAEFGGRRLLSRAELSSDRLTATLFYLENLPASARVQVTLDGADLKDAGGRSLDPDADGQPGGLFRLSFTTASITPLENTAVIGHVFASELGTAGANRPLQGAIVTVDGAEESLRAVTDATGSFRLQPAPAGRFFVHVDGRTAVGSQWPNGAYYPFVGKAWEAVPGRTNNLAGGSGEIFLPLIQADALKSVSATEETKITFVPSVLAANPALAGVEVRVPPNTLFSENGARGGKVGIAPVPPDRLPEPLPAGLNLPIVFTIQTDGPQNFDRPVPVRFPNLPDPVTGVKLGPGEKTVLWSFNHDTGRWEAQGTATITADGNFAETDPGVGVRQPGWHGVADGSPGGGPEPEKKKKEPEEECRNNDGWYDCDGDGCADDQLQCTKEDCEDILKQMSKTLDDCPTSEIIKKGLRDLTCWVPGVKCPPSDYFTKWEACRAKAQKLAQAYLDCVSKSTDFALAGRTLHQSSIITQSLADQERLIQVGTAPERLLLGSDEWAQLEPTESHLWLPMMESFSKAQADDSPGGQTITPEERTSILALPRASNPSLALTETAITRLNAYNQGSMPASERKVIDDALAAYQALWAAYQAAGWQTFFDGFHADNAEVSEQLATVALRTFFASRRLFFVIENLENGFQLRGRLNNAGKFENVILPADTFMRVDYLDPVTPAIGSAVFRSAQAGLLTEIPAAPMLRTIGDADLDGDGLSDSSELILGTAPELPDTDTDGFSDADELAADSNPLDGQPAALGVIASVNLNGSALAIGVQDDVAVVGLNTGVAFIDVRNPIEPVLLGTFVTPGNSTGVTFTRNFAAVSTAANGVALFDLSNRQQPLFLRQISGEATAIAASGDRLYFGAARTLNVVQVDGVPLTALSLPENLDDLQVFDGFLYVLMQSNLQVYAINGAALTARGSVAITGGPIVASCSLGDGYAYVGTFFGWRVVDVRNPDALVVVGTTSTTQPIGHDLAFDGAQLLVITSFTGEQSLAASVYNAKNPTVVTDLLASFNTPGDARAVALHRGYALVADTHAGLTIVNYLARDRGTNPPSVTLRAGFTLATPPTQESDTMFSAIVEGTDDVLVRNVEFYVDDQFVATDTSYPFEVALRAPVLTATKTSFTLRARAFDTGGNAAWSPALTAGLALDMTPPLLLSFTPPADSGFLAGTTISVSARFNEPLAAAALNAGFTLINVGADGNLGTADDIPLPTTATSIGTNEYVLNFSQPLPIGTYAAKLGANLSDLIGNRLAADTSWRFRIQPLIEFVGSSSPVWSSAPQDAVNWSSGRNPTLTDIIQIALPENVVLPVSGQVAALDLTAKSPLDFGGGIDPTMLIGRQAVFEAPVTLRGGTWQGGEVILRGETQISGFMGLVDQDWNNEGHLTLGPVAGLSSGNSPVRRTTLRNLPGAIWEIVDSQMGVGSLQSGPVDFENQGLLIARGASRNFIGTSRFINLGSVEVREGDLELRGGSLVQGASQHLGTYRVDAGAVLRFSGLSQFGRLSRIFGGGNVNIDGPPGGATLFPGGYEIDGETGVSGEVTFSGPVRSSGIWRTKSGHIIFTGLNTEITGQVVSEGALTVAVQPLMRLNELSVYTDLTVATALEVHGPLLLDSTATPSGAIAAARLLGDGRIRANGPLTFAGIVTGDRNGKGTLEIGGSATCQPGAQLGLAGSEIRILPGGTFDVSGADRVSARAPIINEGTLLKTGASTTLLGEPLQNRGTVRVSGGTLQITKGFEQTATGELVITLANTGNSGLVLTSTLATLAGALRVELADGFSPAVGQTFTILTCPLRTGEFTQAVLPDLGAGKKLEVIYEEGAVKLGVVGPQ